MTVASSRWFEPHTEQLAYGDLVMLVTADQKRYLLKLAPRQRLHTHQGAYAHDDLVGQTRGSLVLSQAGQEALLIEPSLADLIKHIKRGTQIIYPKDAAMLVQRLNLRGGGTVLEAGTGSGGLTIALAWAVAPRATSTATRHAARTRRSPDATWSAPICCPMSPCTSAPSTTVSWSRAPTALPGRARRGSIWPTCARRCARVDRSPRWCPRPTRWWICSTDWRITASARSRWRRSSCAPTSRCLSGLRPEDSMVAHTGFLVSAQHITAHLDPARWQSKERRRYLARRRAAAEIEARSCASRSGRGKYPPMPLP
ncbi:MAG: hypothetical protein R2838_15720 [Caldilineaceae bacterium]